MSLSKPQMTIPKKNNPFKTGKEATKEEGREGEEEGTYPNFKASAGLSSMA